MRELLAELERVIGAGLPGVLCTVVATRGSTPQKAGAAMLVFADGAQAGTLGGGCVEAEVKRKALATLFGDGSPHPDLLTFRLDDNYGWDDGLICGGRMDILADPIASAAGKRDLAAAYYRRFRGLVESGQGCTEAVVQTERGPELRAGQRYLFDAVGQVA